MSFPEAIKTCLRKYAVFEGRASRSEFWWFALAYYAFFLLILPVLVVMGRGSTLDQASSDTAVETAAYFVVGLAFYVGLLLPYVSAAVRRLHDTDRSGWWWFIVFIPFGVIVLIVLLASRGDAVRNDYGLPPGHEGTSASTSSALPPPPPPPMPRM
jgi:uncharacterized membrane protein YhaH (DUF805 family)